MKIFMGVLIGGLVGGFLMFCYLYSGDDLSVGDKVVVGNLISDRALTPFCGDFYPPRMDEEFGFDVVWNSFAKPSNFDSGIVRSVFENEEFLKLVEGAEAINYCVYWDKFVFSFYYVGHYPEVPSYDVVGIYFEEWDGEMMAGKMVTARQDFKPLGDIYACGLNGFAGGGLMYSCGGGDGCGGYTRDYILNYDGKRTLIADCDRGCAIGDDWDSESGPQEVCRVDIFKDVR